MDLIPQNNRESHFRAFASFMDAALKDLADFRLEHPNTRDEFALIPMRDSEFKAIFLFQSLLIEMDFVGIDRSKGFWRVPNYVTVDDLAERLDKIAAIYGALKRGWAIRIGKQQGNRPDFSANNGGFRELGNTGRATLQDFEAEFHDLIEAENIDGGYGDLDEELAREMLQEEDQIQAKDRPQNANHETRKNKVKPSNNTQNINQISISNSNSKIEDSQKGGNELPELNLTNTKNILKNSKRKSQIKQKPQKRNLRRGLQKISQPKQKRVDSEFVSRPKTKKRSKRLARKPKIETRSELTKIEEEISVKKEEIKGLISDSENESVYSNDSFDIKELKALKVEKDTPKKTVLNVAQNEEIMQNSDIIIKNLHNNTNGTGENVAIKENVNSGNQIVNKGLEEVLPRKRLRRLSRLKK